MAKAGNTIVKAPKAIKPPYTSKSLPAAGAEPELSALIGGVGNRKGAKNEKK